MLLLLILAPIVFTAGPPDLPRIEVLAQSARPLIPSFHATCDPEPSFDARRLLFSGRKTSAEPWQIYELNLATGKTRQITHGDGGARFPAYQSRIFTLDAPTPWDQVVFVRQGNLHTCTLDGKDCHAITFHPPAEQAGPPTVAWDGRVIYPLTANGRTRLFAVNLDGTDGALLSSESVDAARVGTTADSLHFSLAGTLKTLPLLRPSLGAKILAADAIDPAPLADGKVLAVRGQTLILLSPATGAARVLHRSAAPIGQPRLLASRTPPDGRGSVVDPAEPSGVAYCISAHSSDDPEAARARFVRIHIPGRPPTTAELASDGSFQLKLPANTPVSVETLDATRQPLRRSANFWVRNKENRGCIGCHENPELSPDNRAIEALRQKAVDLTRTTP
jgi:hypothetical protein